MLRLGSPYSARKLILLLLQVLGEVVQPRQGMFEGADERFRVEGLLVGSAAGSSRCGSGGIGEVFDKVLDYKVFALHL